MKVVAALILIGLSPANGYGAGAQSKAVPDEDYSFLTVADGRCLPKIGDGIEPRYRAECQRIAEPRRYRGMWQVEFEGSTFTPAGKALCIEGVTLDSCADLTLVGESLPWPSRWACPRRFELEFIGRRTLHPHLTNLLAYKIAVDKIVSAKRLADPPHSPDECDPAAP